MTASDALTAALVRMAADGNRPPCGEYGRGELWLSDDDDDRRLAAGWCLGCPIIAECHDAAEEMGERFGVWAGVDRTPQKARRP